MDTGQTILGSFQPLGQFGQTMGKRYFAPTVKLSIGNDPNWVVGSPIMPQIAERDLSAIIDTGSEVTRIDIAIAQRLNLQTTGSISSNFTGIKTSTPIYKAQLCFPSELFVIGGELTAVNLRAGGYFHDVILGWEFLSFFGIRLNSKRDLVELTFLGI